MARWLNLRNYIFISAFVLNIDLKKERKIIFSLHWISDVYAKSTPLASLNQYIGLMYDDLGYDENPHLHFLEPAQHSWVLHPSYTKYDI